MPIPPQPEENFSDDIFGTSEYKPQQPQKKTFLPWHKPRKQFVRKKQWCEQILKLIDEITPENNVLKYLGLPGDDLLDLRYFHSIICEPKNMGLKFLGFNTGARKDSDSSAELYVSLDEVINLPYIQTGSDIIGDDICQLGNAKSVAWQRALKMGPCDVINIDLCDGFGKQPHDQFLETHYNALAQLMALQARRANPWLLLLTTRIGPGHTQESVFEILKQLYNINLINCEKFQEASNELFSVNNLETLEQSCTIAKSLADIFMVSLCKWIASLGIKQNPPAKLEVKSVIGYNVNSEAGFSDLVSIAIKIEPVVSAGADSTGLSTIQPVTINECDIAAQVIKRIARLVDADKVLTDNQGMYQEMLSETSSLLEEARYDVNDYPDWALNS